MVDAPPYGWWGEADPRVQLEEKRLRGKSRKLSLIQW
jgi:hypothetical protein